ncbi:MAG: CDP-diacylglycerol--serine O-phosphatidyltransferase, partial [Nitratireductor sp.]|nr:CDP-diacylglycerol--serine O-phosphatidyltransferase [Nitratireductor sp.]
MEPPFPPFEPDEDKSAERQDAAPADPYQQPRLRDIPLRTLFPNILTLLAICSGLTAIRFAIEGRIELAVGAIILAGFLDGIDGRVARFLKSTTRFGAQMDSLADFVNFGVAPAMLLYFTLLTELRPLGWVAALLYAICACLRLARFNVQLDNPNRPDFQQDFFVGVPAPAGAMIVLLPVYLILLGVGETPVMRWFTCGYVIACGLLLVSSLPTYSGKTLGKRVPRSVAMPAILLSVVFIALLLSYPWMVLSAVAIAYLAALPFFHNYYYKLEAQH